MKTHNKSDTSRSGDSFADMLAASEAEGSETAGLETQTAPATGDKTAAPAPEANAAAEDITILPEVPEEMLASLPVTRQVTAGKDAPELKAEPDGQDKPDQAANDNDTVIAAQAPVTQQQPAAVMAPQPVSTATPDAPPADDSAAPAIQDAAPRAAQPQANGPQQASDQTEETEGAESAAAPQAGDKAAAKPATAKSARPAALKTAPDGARPARADSVKTGPAPAQHANGDTAQPVKTAEVPAPPAAAAHNAPQPETLSVAAPAQTGANTAQAAAPEAATPAHHAPDFDKLAVEISARSGTGAKQFDIRLDPPELGRVEVRLSIDATGKAEAHLTADQPQTLDLLQKDAPVLTRALREAGLDVSQDGLNFSLRQQQQQAGQEQHAPGRSPRPLFAASTPIQPAMAAIASRGSAIGLLDIRV